MWLKLAGFQIFAMLFALFMIYLTFIHLKRKEFNTKEYILWTFFWIAFIILAMFPQILSSAAKKLSLANTMELFIILGFIFVIGVLFHNYAAVKKSQRKIEEIVRKIALETEKKKSKENEE